MIRFLKRLKKVAAKKRVWIPGVIILAVGALLAFSGGSGSKVEYSTAKVERQDLLQTVNEVGTVKSADEIQLNFPASGKLAAKFVKIGDEVVSGQILGELDYQSLSIQRSEAESSVQAARASLEKLLRGASASEIAVAEAQVSQAEKNYLSAISSLEKTRKTSAEDIRQAEKSLNDLQTMPVDTAYEQAVVSAQTALDNAKSTYQKAIDNSTDNALTDAGAKLAVANTALDNINKIITDKSLEDYLSSKDKSYLDKTKAAYDQAAALMAAANASLSAARIDKSELKVKKASDDALACLSKTSAALDFFYDALENSTINQTSLDAYKTAISTQSTYVNSALAAVQADRQSLDSAYLSYQTNVSTAQNSFVSARVALDNAVLLAQNSLASLKLAGEQKIAAAENGAATAKEASTVAQRQLSQLKAPARSEDIALAQSKVTQAQASLDLVSKQIQDSLLRSPIDGRLVRDNYEVGEQTSPSKAVFAVLAENNFEIEVDISESDITKLQIGNQAEITLDAFGEDDRFQGEVSFIEPAETVIQDVIYYKVKIKLTDSKEKLARIKSGMTANVTIVTDKKTDALVIPERAIIEKGGVKVVRILKDQKVVEAPVVIGLRGDDGLVEVLSGLVAGQEIVVFVKTAAK